MLSLDEMIARATRQVAEGRRIVEEQRKRIAAGNAVPNAEELLRTFERSLEIMEGHLDKLLTERAGQQESQYFHE